MISQNPNEVNQTGVSLWTVEDIEAAQVKAREAAAAALADANAANGKRTREGDVVADDAATKRQKQGGGGVVLRRNRVGDPSAPQ